LKNRLWFLGIALALLGWELGSRLLSSLVLPAPGLVLRKLSVLLLSGALLSDIGVTLLRVLLGVGLGFGLGVMLGLLLAHSRLLSAILDPVLQLLRPISPFAWTPLVILLSGLGNLPAVVTILIGILFPAVVTVLEAIRNIDPDLRDIARTFGVTGSALIVEVEMPLVWPTLVAALRILFGVGWVLAVGAEMLAANSGLGFRLMNARYLLDFPALYALILCIGIVGFGLDFALKRLELLVTR
jgi:NitT/TauT family transport system permease protein